MRGKRLAPLVAAVAAATLSVVGCGGGGGATVGANKGAPISKQSFCAAAKAFEQDTNNMQGDQSLSAAKGALPKILADAKAMTPAPAGLQSSMDKVIKDLSTLNNWVQKQTSDNAMNNPPSNVKGALKDYNKHPQVRTWLQKNCPGVVDSGSGNS